VCVCMLACFCPRIYYPPAPNHTANKKETRGTPGAVCIIVCMSVSLVSAHPPAPLHGRRAAKWCTCPDFVSLCVHLWVCLVISNSPAPNHMASKQPARDSGLPLAIPPAHCKRLVWFTQAKKHSKLPLHNAIQCSVT